MFNIRIRLLSTGEVLTPPAAVFSEQAKLLLDSLPRLEARVQDCSANALHAST